MILAYSTVRKSLGPMFVGGPNTRSDFHINEGSEFFWMYRGRMELPIIEPMENGINSIMVFFKYT